MVLPVLTMPFVTGLLWALQSPAKNEKATKMVKGEHGLNADLPGAHLKDDRGVDKMSFYDQAEIDSVKKGEKLKAEAFYGRRLGDSFSTGHPEYADNPGRVTSDPNEEKIHRKLADLETVLHTASTRAAIPVEKEGPATGIGLDRLEKRLQELKNGKEDNPEMEEMNKVLDKLIRVQHPEMVHDSLRDGSEKNGEDAWPVGRAGEEGSVSLLAGERTGGVGRMSNRFYDLSDSVVQKAPGNLLEALIPEPQTLVNGSTVKLAFVNDVLIGGIEVHAGTAIYGLAALNNERLRIDIHSIRCGDRMLPVNLQVYDQDGLEGIYIPGAIGRDVVKQSADQGLNSFGLSAYDPSLSGQAAAAGIQLAKSMISRKVKLVRVAVAAGYRVWLRDGKQH